MHKNYLTFARISLFIVYFWFGILKVFSLSPAEGIVKELFSKTIPIMPFETFFLLFGVFECVLGLMFLIRGLEKFSLALTAAHIFTTTLPLLLMPTVTWNGFLIPTLEGQYIIKNVLIVSLASIINHVESRQKKLGAILIKNRAHHKSDN